MRLIAILLFVSVAVPSMAATPPEPVEVAPGVHVIIHPDANPNWPNGNTTIVVGPKSVLVVDAAYLPSVAEADIAAIRKITSKPVRFLVNTHWHYDHNNGNSAYHRAFPEVEIVAHIDTRRLMDANSPRYIAAVVAESSPVRQELANRRADSAPAGEIADRERELAELSAYVYTPPTMTFDRELRLDLGGREVRILNFGRGNTPGDAVIHVPDVGVVATGDLVVAPIPYTFNSYPVEWIQVLDRVMGLRARVLIPGHGPVMHDDAYVRRVSALLQNVVAQVMAAIKADPQAMVRDPLAAVRARMDFTALRAEFVGDEPAGNAMFDSSIVNALVERVVAYARGSQ